MVDYMMSKRFGLEWKLHDHKRMSYLLAIESEINKLQNDSSKKN